MSRGFKLRDLVYLSLPPSSSFLLLLLLKFANIYACTQFKMSSASKKGRKSTARKDYLPQPQQQTWLS